MASLNKVMIIGNLGRDPELKELPSGSHVVNFSVASTRKYKDREGNPQEETEWVNVVGFDKLAETCAQFLHKGSKVYLSGRLQTRSWDDATTGEKRYRTEVRLEDVQFLSPKQDGPTKEDPANAMPF